MDMKLISTRAVGSVRGALKQHAPTILTGVGIAGFVATTVLVGKAALNSRGVVADTKEYVDSIVDRPDNSTKTKKELTKEVGEAWVETGVTLGKVYAPAIIVGAVSISCVLAGHGIMLKRQSALVAAYGVLDAGFKAYRKRVQDEVGEEKELDLYRGVKKMRIFDAEGTDVGEVIDFSDQIPSPYARFFDETSRNWSKTPEYNHVFLRSQQQWANDKLTAYGYLFLNEVYEALGLERTQSGQVVGWKKETEDGDGFVDFGLYDQYNESSRNFINGLEATVLLDFNVDGVIRI
jgi:hypothetical protein